MSAVKRCWLILILAPTMAWSQGPAANEDGGHAKLFDLDAGVGDKVAVGWMGDPQVKLPDDWTFFEAENETSDSDCAKKVSLQRPGQLFVGDFHSNQDFLKTKAHCSTAWVCFTHDLGLNFFVKQIVITDIKQLGMIRGDLAGPMFVGWDIDNLPHDVKCDD